MMLNFHYSKIWNMKSSERVKIHRQSQKLHVSNSRLDPNKVAVVSFDSSLFFNLLQTVSREQCGWPAVTS